MYYLIHKKTTDRFPAKELTFYVVTADEPEFAYVKLLGYLRKNLKNPDFSAANIKGVTSLYEVAVSCKLRPTHHPESHRKVVYIN